MLKIGICDRDEGYVEQLHNLLVKFLFSEVEPEICHFENGEEIIALIESGSFSLDMLFIDVGREALNDMKTIKFIRKHCIKVDLFFLTDSPEKMPEGYNFHAYAWYQKPVRAELLKKDLQTYINERSKKAENFSVSTKGKDVHIPLDRIIYFKSEKRKITAHTLTASISFYAKMNEVERLVSDKDFIRCHQSYIVNRNMIDIVERKELIVQGIHIPMSRKYYEKIEVIEEIGSMSLTKGVAISKPKNGVIVFVKGDLEGAVIRIRPEKEICLGRDGEQADIVMYNKKISRLHCGIRYHIDKGEYTICDYSKNGIVTKDGKRTKRNQSIRILAGEEICLGNSENIIRLG